MLLCLKIDILMKLGVSKANEVYISSAYELPVPHKMIAEK